MIFIHTTNIEYSMINGQSCCEELNSTFCLVVCEVLVSERNHLKNKTVINLPMLSPQLSGALKETEAHL